MSDVKIIQIMPAPAGLKGVSWDDNGNRITVRLLAMGLTDKGTFEFPYLDRDGETICYAHELTYYDICQD